jgi:hypothetical protein
MKSEQNTESLYFTSVKTGLLNNTTFNTAFGYRVNLIQSGIQLQFTFQFAEGTTTTWGQDSVVSVATRHGLDSPGIASWWE